MTNADAGSTAGADARQHLLNCPAFNELNRLEYIVRDVLKMASIAEDRVLAGGGGDIIEDAIHIPRETSELNDFAVIQTRDFARKLVEEWEERNSRAWAAICGHRCARAACNASEADQ